MAASTANLAEPLNGEPMVVHASQPSEVVFRSRGTHFRAVIRPSRREQHPHGVEFVPGEACDFAPHAEFRTSDSRIAEHLRGLASCGTEFYEVGNEPGRIPSSERVIAAIMEASVELDDARLGAIEVEERGQFRREDVLVAVAAARRQVQRILEEKADVVEPLVEGVSEV